MLHQLAPELLINSLVYNESDSLILVMTDQYEVIHANKALLNCFGISLDQILLKSLTDVVEIDPQLLPKEIQSQQIVVANCILSVSMGNLAVEAKIKREVYGEMICYVAVISLAQNAFYQDAMRKSAKIIEAVPIGVVVISDKKVVFANHRISEITGYSFQDLLDIQAHNLAVQDESFRVDEFIKNLTGDFQSDSTVEYWTHKKDGSRVFLRNKYVKEADCSFVMVKDLTAVKVGEITRIRSEERSVALLNAMPDMMFLFDMNGVIIDYHCKTPDLLYKAPSEFMYKDISNVLPPSLVDMTLDKIEQVIVTGESVVYEYQIELEDKVGYFESRLVACGENGFLSIVRDISEQKRIMGALQESEMLFRQTLDNAPVSIVIVEVSGALLYANTKVLELFEVERFSADFNVLADQVWKEPGQGREWLDKVLQLGSVKNLEVEFNTFKGGLKWVMVCSEKIKYQNKWAILSTIIDMSDRINSELDLQKRDVVLDVISNFASKALSENTFEDILYDALSQIGKTLNVGAVFMFEISNKVVANRKFVWTNDLLDGFSREAFQDCYDLEELGLMNWLEVLKQKHCFVSQISNCTPSEKVLFEVLQIKTMLLIPIMVQNGLWGFIGFEDYEVERNWRNSELDSLNTVADILGATISRERATNELILAKEKAEEINKLKSYFLSNMSHELRTPLIGILGAAEIIAKEESIREANNWAGIIKNSGGRLLESLNLILDFSKLEANKVNVNLQLINIVDIIVEVTSLFKSVAISKGITIETNMPFDSVLVLVDVRLFRESLNNLVNNAVKFTLNGGVVISVDLADDNVNIHVADTGIGIPEDKMDQVFEEFRQESEGLSRGFDGTGLGLTITKRFIEMMDGAIHVESVFGVGTVFTITLPLYQKDLISSSFVFSNPIEVLPNKEDFNFIRSVLLVENDEINQKLIRKYLEDYFVVTSAYNGEDALEMTRNQMFNLVLMDINLGEGKNGVEVTQELRKFSFYSRTPIVAITAFAIEGDREEFLHAGCSHYLSKPFTKPQLLSLIKEIDQAISY